MVLFQVVFLGFGPLQNLRNLRPHFESVCFSFWFLDAFFFLRSLPIHCVV